nr:uncharacterized protein LOC109121040 [Solanum lycopersicum]
MNPLSCSPFLAFPFPFFDFLFVLQVIDIAELLRNSSPAGKLKVSTEQQFTTTNSSSGETKQAWSFINQSSDDLFFLLAFINVIGHADYMCLHHRGRVSTFTKSFWPDSSPPTIVVICSALVLSRGNILSLLLLGTACDPTH